MKPSSSALRLCEHVTGAAHGQDSARAFGVVFEDRAQACDMNVDRAVERGVVLLAAANEFCEHFARQDAAGALRHGVEKIELVARERPLFIADPRDAAAPVDFETPKAETIGRAAMAPRRSTTRMRAKSSRGSKGFATWILGADLEADNLVHRIAART